MNDGSKKHWFQIRHLHSKGNIWNDTLCRCINLIHWRQQQQRFLYPCWKSEQGHGKEIFVQKYPLAVPSRHDRREYSGITHNQTADKVPKRQRTEREQREMSVYSVQIRAFLGVFCVRGIIILPMPLLCIVEPLRATTSDSESDIIQAAAYSRNTWKQVNIRLYQNRTNVQN